MAQGLPPGHGQCQGSFHLGLGNRDEACPVVFGLVSGVVQAEPDCSRHEGRKLNADVRQAVEDEEQLDQDRRAPDRFDVGDGNLGHERGAEHPRDGKDEPEGHREEHCHYRYLHRGERGPSQHRHEAGISLHSFLEGEFRFLLLGPFVEHDRIDCPGTVIVKLLGHHRAPEVPAVVDPPEFPAVPERHQGPVDLL